MAPNQNSKVKEMYEAVVDYSGYSTLAGLIYVFMPNQPTAGKVFWVLCIIFMLALGAYWSWYMYADWQEKPVLTTVTTTALPVSEIPFPAVTICSEGYDLDIFDAAIFKIFFDFVKANGGPMAPWTPIEAAMLNNKQIYFNLTQSENNTVTEINKLQEKYWASFLTKSFPGLSPAAAPNLNKFDWVVLLNQADPVLSTAAYALKEQCNSLTNMTCFDVFTDPVIGKNAMATMIDTVTYVATFLGETDFTSGFKVAFSSLWHSKLPCFDTQGISSLAEGDRGILKQCKWKGIIVPCSGIFTTFPTDRGMCCSFNIKAADEIFTDSQFSALVKQLQAEDYNTSFENSTLPDWFIENNEPTTQPGINMGLEVILDAHSNVVESFSINNDFEGFTGLITDSGDFPLTNLRGFNIKAGHHNLVAISAVSFNSDDDFEGLKSETRKCLYPDEIGNMKLFKSYSQANCFLECGLNFAQRKLENEQNLTLACTPWFFPFADDTFRMCDPFQRVEIIENMKKVSSQDCSHCLPDCIRTVYDQRVTTQPFRRCDERNLYLTEFCTMEAENGIRPQIWARQVVDNFMATTGKVPSYLSHVQSGKRTIKESYVLPKFFEGLTKEYDAYEKDIAVLRVFFDSSTVMQFKSQPRQSWIDYFAAVGGALGLCIGLSIMTVIEIVWLCFRMCGLCNKREDPDEVKHFEEN